MKIISAAAHGLLDYLFLLLLIFMPFAVLKPGSVAASYSFITAALQLLLIIFSRYRAGFIKYLSFRVHGYIELGIAITLSIVAFGFLADHLLHVFVYYISVAALYVLVFFLTDFNVSAADKQLRFMKKNAED